MPEDKKSDVGTSYHGGKSRSVSIASKLEIIKKMEKGVSIQLIMAQYNLDKTSVHDIILSKERILRLPQITGATLERCPKGDDKPHYFNGGSTEDAGGISAENGFPKTLESPRLLSPSQDSEIPEQLHVQNSNHLRHIMEALARDEDFVDVTLTAEGRAIRAHKFVLSAMSPYFQQVLYNNPCRHPIIIMPHHMQFDHLTHIIEYMYKGEITVAEDQLKTLLKSAKLLQVTGLTISQSELLSTDNCLSTEDSPTTSYIKMNYHLPEYATVASPLNCSARVTEPLNCSSRSGDHKSGSHEVEASSGSSEDISFPTADPFEETNSHFSMRETSNTCNNCLSGTTTFRKTTDVTNNVPQEDVKMETDITIFKPSKIKANSLSTFSGYRNICGQVSLEDPVQAVALDGSPVTANIVYDMSDQNISHTDELQEQPLGDLAFNNSLPDDKPITFEEVQNGTKRKGRKLVRSDGFTYTVKRKNSSCTYWICSVRNKKLRCPAYVKQCGDTFITSSHMHMHQACPKMVNKSERT